jgi:hypothetical protein
LLKFFEYIWFYDYSFITQHEALLMLRIAHQIENVNAPIDMNFNSNPCNGNIANPPTIPSTAVSDVVQAGHPGVNAVSAPPNIAPAPLFTFLSLCVLMLYATNAMLIPC